MTYRKILLCGVLMSGLAGAEALAAAETEPGAAAEPEKVKKMGGPVARRSTPPSVAARSCRRGCYQAP